MPSCVFLMDTSGDRLYNNYKHLVTYFIVLQIYIYNYYHLFKIQMFLI